MPEAGALLRRVVLADRRLTASIDDAFARAASRAGAAVTCRAGCTACCIGPFDVSALDALRLRIGLGSLLRDERERGEAVMRRAAQAWERMRGAFPGRAPVLAEDDLRRERFFAAFAGEPCPALEPREGTCALYAYRPLSCRAEGLPARYGDTVVDACPLNFVGAPEKAGEEAAVDVDPGDLEGALLGAMAAGGLGYGDTVVAVALHPSASGLDGVDKLAEKENIY